MRVGKKVVRKSAKAKSPRQSQGGGGYAPANRAGDGGDVGAKRPSESALGGIIQLPPHHAFRTIPGAAHARGSSAASTPGRN